MAETLEFKSIHSLLGENFYIPHYQRGYRWTEKEVIELLNDIWAFANKQRIKEKEFYCLQPVVVKAKSWERNFGMISGWEVVDGQQRLTTIYIIISYLAKEFLKLNSLAEEYNNELYSIQYETRPGSEVFLKNISDDRSNIDYYHISDAYRIVKDWFECGKFVKDRSDRDKFLRTILGREDHETSVQIIWYNVAENIKGLELFRRLNIGKIPLTNSELIKALFLSSSSLSHEDDPEVKKLQISLHWDEIERRLSDHDFWAFITNFEQSSFDNRIELIFDMIAGKSKKDKKPLYTFRYFFDQSKENKVSLWEMWLKVEKYYDILQEWYKDKSMYHKIGYLITIGRDLKQLIDEFMESRKDRFENHLDSMIRTSINYDITDLSYERPGDYERIKRVLLLFNIESIRTNESINERYPFKFHKHTEWSLEHIHAQNSEGLDKTKRNQWLSWLDSHNSLLKEVVNETKDLATQQNFTELIEEIERINQNRDRLTWERFQAVSEKIAKHFSEAQDVIGEDEHGIANLALIGQAQNSALNNSVFEVKRREVIRMDREGKYIPICTRRVFLKYYNKKLSSEHYYFWGHEDRENYLTEIKRVLGLSEFLPTETLTEV